MKLGISPRAANHSASWVADSARVQESASGVVVVLVLVLVLENQAQIEDGDENEDDEKLPDLLFGIDRSSYGHWSRRAAR